MTISIDFLIRVVSLFVFFGWWLYWRITEQVAEKNIPKTKQEGILFRKQQIRRLILRIAEGIMIFQVIGIRLLSFLSCSFITQVIGFLFVLIGFSLAISARKTLGNNWSHAYEYQVKNKQQLIITGIYSRIRHPIYSGLCMAFIGGELVAQSYLVVIGLILLIGGYWQARQEEMILSNHFGNAYPIYMKRSKMFIPFLW